MKLDNARILLLGGTSGIGFAIAAACLDAGAIVIISSSTEQRLSSALSRLRASYPHAEDRIQGHLCDLSDPQTVEENLLRLLDLATDHNTVKLDHITYTAANIPRLPPLSNYTAGSLGASFTIRVEAPILLGKLAGGYLHPGPQSSITFTSASTATKPTPGRGLLTVLGASTEGIAKGLAVDLAPIRVNVVAPGTVDTELLRGLAGDNPGRFYDFLKSGTLLKRIGNPQDVAEAYLYLMRDANVTGGVIHTDGGRLLQ
ncbi:hypothetical protein ASPZODRAFT_147258 [Penicilliopsis zonata CBS 506.65]|uniref:Ketoreductase (KR) domain-containing protein n=1 Tax=Penicilliopsis zonata CBS 506.65 TaxID=1073090 RepID=A0A1L9S644_9EURO|nr:hypothetical protein ASPZODRAFT_147258 [Penicilliopsis zonata CBS 506.65]OJJ42626.1 hypothetical protein ASPZODRAFT_147258 [Penicilliopsis zonata CBS 506.65]